MSAAPTECRSSSLIVIPSWQLRFEALSDMRHHNLRHYDLKYLLNSDYAQNPE